MALSLKRGLIRPAVLVIAAIAALTAVQASAATLAISTAALPGGEVNVPYSENLSATGGTAPYTWAVVGGALPAGVSLNPATGQLSGTPTTAGPANFTVQVSDASAGTATRALTIVVEPAVTVTTLSLPDGQVGLAYAETVAKSGGVGPFNWDISVGTLPAGLSLNASTGAITGTPTTAGLSNFTVRATDALAQQDEQALAITVDSAGTLVITTASLPNGTVGAGYMQTLTAAGGTAPYVWTVSVGSLPAGLALSAGGVLGGTATASGTSSFSVMVADSAAGNTTRAYTLAISPLTMTTASLPDGSVGAAYNETLAASGGTTPHNWSVTGGALPAGLSLNALTGAITGTPTTAGTSTFTAQVIDALAATATKTLTIEIADEEDGAESGDRQEKVTVCHIPPGNPDNAHTITVGEPALEAHLAHGDTEDECPEAAPASSQSEEDGKGKGKKANPGRGRGPR
jgi:hypothetical protein